MKYILETKNLSGGYVPAINILQNVNMELSYGETVSVIGLNGSGKSTLGKAVMNMLPHRDGDILFEGTSVTGLATHDLARLGMSIMQQGGQVFKNLSVEENLQLAFNRQTDNSYISLLESVVPLIRDSRNNSRAKRADKLSGGERQQLALAMALALKPRMLILDEPSAGLSPIAVDEMYSILECMRNKMNISLLLIEQNINKAITFSDRCMLLEQGRIAQTITSKNIDEIECLMFKK